MGTVMSPATGFAAPLRQILCAAVLLMAGSGALGATSYLDNGTVKIGVNTSRGAGISFFARTSDGRNMLNNHDTGRYVQQSYYGDFLGATWNGQPWPWNPVQGGSATGNPSQLLEFVNGGAMIYSKVKPRDWAGGSLLNCTMEQWITLPGDYARVHVKFVNSDRNNTANSDQEMPAMFVDYDLSDLVYYKGTSPWSYGSLTRVQAPGFPNRYDSINENWAAYVDGNDFGIGVYVPGTSRMTYYRYYEGSGGGGPGSANCSYIAPIRTMTISLGKTVEYDCYLYIGDINNIRQKFYDIRALPTCTLTVLSSPATGASITVNPPDNAGHLSGTTNFTRAYSLGTNVSLTAPATLSGKPFSKWVLDGADDGMNATTTVNMNTDHTMVAVYTATAIECSVASIDRTAPFDGVLADDAFTVRNSGVDTLNYTISDDMSWLSVSPTEGSSTGEADVINTVYDLSGLEIGDYTGSITISDPNAINSPLVIPVNLHVTPTMAMLADFDDDGDVDLEDFGRLQACFSTSSWSVTPPECLATDLNGDTIINQADCGLFLMCLSGSNVPVQPDCGH